MNAVPGGGAARRRTGAPRSGGRTAAHHTDQARAGRPAPPVDGATALAAQPAAPRRRAASWLTVAPPAPVAVPRAPFVALLLLVVVGGVLGILVVNTTVMENAFKLQTLQQQHAALDQEEAELRKKIEDAEAPNSLYRAAERLGMTYDGQPAVITLPNGRKVELPSPLTDPVAARTGSRSDKQDITRSNERRAGR
ncbi:hypothetical protein GCM10010124_18320 [Pilimelia terevasa]|uniref:Cell division protein FtsL n=1 Tax=Pilimelia terevasa TaxID=53372 RepID=A0A8J3BMX7_9ACTN|nr:hypothetical protein [Pilimelia terevasa]GGK26088.1 hypothetical protein GCM10010124_18320 [Pilimelia terevasa]